MVLTPTSYYKDKYGNVLETPRNQFAKNNAEFDELISYELSPRKTDGNNTYVFEYAQLSEGVGESKTFVKELGKSEIIDGVFKMPEVQDVRVTEDHPVIELYYALDNNGSGGTSDNIPDYKENDVTYKGGNGGLLDPKQPESNTWTDGNIYPAGANLEMAENMFTREGAEFAGWLYGSDIKGAGTKFMMPDNPVTLTAQWKSVQVNKSFEESTNEDKKFKLGETIHFTITVRNNGDVPLNTITVTDSLPDAYFTEDAGSNYEVSGDKKTAAISNLEKDTAVTISAEYVVTDAEIGNEDFRNTATAKFGETEVDGTTDKIPMDGVKDQLTVRKTIDRRSGDASGKVGADGVHKLFITGDTVHFIITVANTGSRTIKVIVVTEDSTKLKDAKITGTKVLGEEDLIKNLWKKITGNYYVKEGKGYIDSLKPGEVAAFEAEYEIKVSDLGRTDLVNVVIADGKNADGESIPSTSGTSDPIPVEDVYTLTVRYLYSTGATAAAAYTGKYLAGEIYKVDSPSISGYNWSAAFVAGTMPAQDLTLDIIYTAQGGGGGTGGGGGEDPTPTPQPGDTPTPPVVPPVTPPVTPTPPATPVEPAGGENVAVILPEIDTAAVGDEPVPLGALVDVDDNGNVTLTPIEEDDVPLAGGEKSDKWALLNFALMNLAVFESLMLLIGYFVNTKNDNEEEEKRKLKKKGIFRVISLPIAVLALVVFILTEDITLPTGFVDKYTIFMVIIAIVQTVMVAFSRKKYEEEEEEEVTQSVQ